MTKSKEIFERAFKKTLNLRDVHASRNENAHASATTQRALGMASLALKLGIINEKRYSKLLEIV